MSDLISPAKPSVTVTFTRVMSGTTVTVTGPAENDDDLSDTFGSFLAARSMVASSNLNVGNALEAAGLPHQAAPTPIDFAARNYDMVEQPA